MPLIRRKGAQQEAASPPRTATPPPTQQDVRREAARALAVARDPAGLAASLRHETDASVREVLLTGLIACGDPRPLADFLRSEDAALRAGAVGALRVLAPAALAILPALLTDQDPDVRLLATEIALGLPAAEATAALTPVLLHDTDENVCAAAVEVLCAVGTQAAVPALLGLPGRFAGNTFLAFSCEAAVSAIRGSAP